MLFLLLELILENDCVDLADSLNLLLSECLNSVVGICSILLTAG